MTFQSPAETAGIYISILYFLIYIYIVFSDTMFSYLYWIDTYVYIRKQFTPMWQPHAGYNTNTLIFPTCANQWHTTNAIWRFVAVISGYSMRISNIWTTFAKIQTMRGKIGISSLFTKKTQILQSPGITIYLWHANPNQKKCPNSRAHSFCSNSCWPQFYKVKQTC